VLNYPAALLALQGRILGFIAFSNYATGQSIYLAFSNAGASWFAARQHHRQLVQADNAIAARPSARPRPFEQVFANGQVL
jgi:hypothetical protein